MARNIRNVKGLQKKSRRLEVKATKDPHVVAVKSGSQENVWYMVRFNRDFTEATCTCPWAQKGGKNCSHVMAAIRYLARLKGHRVSFWLSEEDARRQKRRIVNLAGMFATVRPVA